MWLGFIMYNELMKDLLKKTHDQAEGLEGHKLLYTLVAIFAAFLVIGFASNYFIKTILNNPERDGDGNGSRVENAQVSYKGIITYVDPRNYPDDEISYLLTEPQGKLIILLTAHDSKLEVSEGLYATVSGTLMTTSDGSKEVLLVEKVSISNK